MIILQTVLLKNYKKLQQNIFSAVSIWNINRYNFIFFNPPVFEKENT